MSKVFEKLFLKRLIIRCWLSVIFSNEFLIFYCLFDGGQVTYCCSGEILNN